MPPTAGRLTADSGTRADLDVACGWIALLPEMASTETATSAATGVTRPAMRRRIFLAGKDIWDENFVMMIIPN